MLKSLHLSKMATLNFVVLVLAAVSFSQVAYCTDNSKHVCEGKTLSIKCDHAQARIDILDAMYGRKNKDVCWKFYGHLWSTSCNSSKAFSEVQKLCQGKSACSVKAANSLFDDPCFLTEKYLKIKYACRVDGGFSEWEEFDKCSKSCGGGVRVRTRTCTNPAPANGGKSCKGVMSESEICNNHPCPVNGGYTQWSKYGECSESCGGGMQTRSRECSNPEPAHGGKDCSELGDATESRKCNTAPCPVNGGYSKWSEYGECSESCGGGTQSRTRECNNPEPAHGGKDCSDIGESSESRECNRVSCPVPVSQEMSKHCCEGKHLSIQCSGDATIMITYAMYGRRTKNICYKWYGKYWKTNCEAKSSLSKVKNACEGKSSCKVYAKNKVFGDPCFLTQKYLLVKFKCKG